MPNIRPISALRNSANESSDFCKQTREPVFITRNGTGDMVVQSMAEYERQQALIDLYSKLSVAEAEIADGAEGEDILRVPARERVAGGLGPGALDDLEIRVFHPRARDAKDKLEKLVDDRADEADREHIVPAGLAHAPEHDDGSGHKHKLAAAVGERAEHRVQKRCAQLCQCIK